MPEVKWVDPNDMYEYHGNYVHRTPVLTLDQIKAWLKEMRTPLCNFRPTPQANRIAIGVYDDLLAQVQAWQEGK